MCKLNSKTLAFSRVAKWIGENPIPFKVSNKEKFIGYLENLVEYTIDMERLCDMIEEDLKMSKIENLKTQIKNKTYDWDSAINGLAESIVTLMENRNLTLDDIDEVLINLKGANNA